MSVKLIGPRVYHRTRT